MQYLAGTRRWDLTQRLPGSGFFFLDQQGRSNLRSAMLHERRKIFAIVDYEQQGKFEKTGREVSYS